MLFDPRGVEQPVRHAGRGEHGAGLDLDVAAEMHGMDRPARLEAHDVARQHHLRAEAPGLRHGPVREVGAGEALREPEVVLDRRALAGLAAGRFALDDDGPQSFRRAVYGRRKTGGPAADDAEVVQRLLGARPQAERIGEVERRRRTQRLLVGDEHEWEVCGVRFGRVVQPECFVVAFEIEPLVWHVVAREECLDLVATVRPAVADDPQDGVRRGVGFTPVVQQVVDDRVQALFRRIPGLQEVVVEPDLVDRLDRDVGVGVRGEKHELGAGHMHARLLEKCDASHSGHALIGEDQRDLAVSQDVLGQHRERFGT